MANTKIITRGYAGVDMQENAFLLPEGRVSSAINMKFQDGRITTRDGIYHHNLGINGQVKGNTVYSPSRGLSHKPFGDPVTALVLSVGDSIHYSLVCNGEFSKSNEICGECNYCGCESVNLYQAENYLIIQSPQHQTAWWEGSGCYVCSPGLGECGTIEERICASERIEKTLVGAQMDCCFQEITYCQDNPIIQPDVEHSSHDTFDFNKHRNFLVNNP